MKLEQAHIDQIRTAFAKMKSREDLLHVLNEAKPMVYGDKAVPFELKQLTWYAYPKLGRKRYSEFKIKKKSGAERCIHAPVNGLNSLQKTLSFVLQCVYKPHNAAMGFVRERSIVENAKLHVGNKYVYNIDLKDFFPSIDQARVWKCLQLKPFNLNKASSVEPPYIKWEDFKKEHLKTDKPVTFLKSNGRMCAHTPYGTIYLANNFDKEKDKYILLGSSSLKINAGKSLQDSFWLVNKIPDTSRLDMANIIASLCCTEMEVERKTETGEWEKVKRNVLPQGAPTSPVITNIVCQKLDYLLSGVAKRFGLKYSRYADDITFSSMHNVYQPESNFLKELHRIIAEQNFHIKESKTRLQKDGYRKEVTGLLVNEKANVQKRYIKQLRMWLYYWERYGYERASEFFLQQYITDKGHVKNGNPDMEKVISGKLDYLKMVKGSDNELYLKLKSRFKDLNTASFKSKSILKAVSTKEINTNQVGNTLDAYQSPKKNEIFYKSIKEWYLKLKSRFKILNASSFKSKTISEASHTAEIDTNQVKITLEVYQSPKKNQKLFNSINIPKDTVLPNTIIVPNSIEEIEEDNKSNKLFPHNPMYTISFLKNFKIGDGSGFKELVHDVILSDETIQEILNKVKSHPNFIYHYKKEWISNVSYLNKGIIYEVRRLIDLFEKEGLPFYFKTGKHPFNNDQKYSDIGLMFKKSYRYGSGKEYSKLLTNIVEVFTEMNLTECNLQFLPSERIFNIRSNFFTWEPSISKGLRYIFQGIRDHFNINGIALNEEKTIQIEAEDINLNGLRFLELRIIDFNSQANLNSEKLLHFLKESNSYKEDFRNLCDWIIECDFLEESPKRFNLLIAPEYSQSFQEIEELPNPIGGFKHILRFYDVR
jgi:hypothetical protein